MLAELWKGLKALGRNLLELAPLILRATVGGLKDGPAGVIAAVTQDVGGKTLEKGLESTLEKLPPLPGNVLMLIGCLCYIIALPVLMILIAWTGVTDIMAKKSVEAALLWAILGGAAECLLVAILVPVLKYANMLVNKIRQALLLRRLQRIFEPKSPASNQR